LRRFLNGETHNQFPHPRLAACVSLLARPPHPRSGRIACPSLYLTCSTCLFRCCLQFGRHLSSIQLGGLRTFVSWGKVGRGAYVQLTVLRIGLEGEVGIILCKVIYSLIAGTRNLLATARPIIVIEVS
jgi:hypothetical protein